MTPEDADRIERSLEITLPADYRQIVESFPLPAYAGNTETVIWDDADQLIKYNRELRRGGGSVKPWPSHFYALGRDSGGCSQAIDLRTGELWWADRSHLDGAGSYKHAEPFRQWAAEYIEGLREDLIGEGGDPSATPQQRRDFETHQARASTRLWKWFFVAGIGVVLVVVLWRAL